MSSILASRTRLLAALEAGGVRWSTTGKLAAPCVLVEPGDPWSTWSRMPGRNGQWRLSAVAGRADTDGALEAIGELVDKVDAALRLVADVGLPTWGRPFDLEIAGVKYAASVATISLTSA